MKHKVIKAVTAWLVATVLTSIMLINSESTIRAYADGGVTINLHYHRDDGAYEPWSVWFWEAGKDGSDNKFSEINGEMVATFSPSAGTTSVGFIVRTEEWAKDWPDDQFIDIAEMVSGTVDIYVESGTEGYAKEYGTDAVKGIKLKTAKYDGTTKITVTMTDSIDNYNDAFIVSGKDTDVSIDSVNMVKAGIYEIVLTESLDNFKHYTIAYDETIYEVNMKNIYSTAEFEKEYTYEGNDLGATYTAGKTTFKVWAPTAENVSLNLYVSGDARMKDLIENVEMKKGDKGVWEVTVNKDLKGVYYTYTAVHDGKKSEACDPYAVTTGVNGDRAMVINLNDTNPEGWENDTNPNSGKNITDAVIYEAHIRDLTVGDTGITNKGKYIGVIEEGTVSSNGIATGLDHMKDLGITHLHILPMYDFGSVDELKSVVGVYNWGYDPVNYNVPEGSYSTDPQNGEVRVKEVKEMVKGLHDSGISVVMDVVYNHVYNAEKFSFNKLVPGYFSRITDEGTYSNGSGCGNDTASERSMVKKYIVDSVNYWADEYHIDGFRFDLVGLIDVETINEIVNTVHEKHPDVIFYGEGWSMTTLTTKDNVMMATQVNSENTPGFAYFNDTMRDGIKGSVFDKGCGFVSGANGYASKISRCFMGADNWCISPSQTINYASCHDNNTLFDRLALSRPDATKEDLIKMNNLSAAIYMLSEGVPFMQAGEEMLRSKVKEDGSFDENSYASGDKVNAIDYSVLANSEYSDTYNFYKELIAFRKNHPVLRLTDREEVEKSIKEIKLGNSQVLAFEISGTLDNGNADHIFIVYNASEDSIDVSMPEGDWKRVLVSYAAGDLANEATTEGNETENTGTVTVSPITAAVYVDGVDLFDNEQITEGTVLTTTVENERKSKGLAAGVVGGIAVIASAIWLIRRKKK